MKSKRMKSILLIGLAMFLVAGIIWSSFSVANATAATQSKKSTEQNARIADDSGDAKAPKKSENTAKSKADETGVRNRTRAGDNGKAGQSNTSESGLRTRARAGGEGEHCDETCPNYATRDERREQNRANAEGRVRDRANAKGRANNGK